MTDHITAIREALKYGQQFRPRSPLFRNAFSHLTALEAEVGHGVLPASTYVEMVGGIWHAGLRIGNQSFTLAAHEDTEKEANWYAEMLTKALAHLATPKVAPVEASPWVKLTAENQPPTGCGVVYWHESESGGYLAIADEWNWYHHGPKASHFLPSSIASPST